MDAARFDDVVFLAADFLAGAVFFAAVFLLGAVFFAAVFLLGAVFFAAVLLEAVFFAGADFFAARGFSPPAGAAFSRADDAGALRDRSDRELRRLRGFASGSS
ncbi:hypothetical protein ABT040_45775, partial [Streptomyces sp. NPDC002688]|uniref:hypothetical protein n=1 Tax=Streptomyces sp. NPDC002688 TaxID=3154423 RepID=UPI003333FD38